MAEELENLDIILPKSKDEILLDIKNEGQIYNQSNESNESDISNESNNSNEELIEGNTKKSISKSAKKAINNENTQEELVVEEVVAVEDTLLPKQDVISPKNDVVSPKHFSPVLSPKYASPIVSPKKEKLVSPKLESIISPKSKEPIEEIKVEEKVTLVYPSIPKISCLSYTNNSLLLSFDCNNVNKTGYLLQELNALTNEYKESYNGFKNVYEVSNLKAGTKYSFRCRAYDTITELNSEYSDVYSFNTTVSPPSKPVDPKCLFSTSSALHLVFTLPENNGSPLTQLVIESSFASNPSFSIAKIVPVDQKSSTDSSGRPRPMPAKAVVSSLFPSIAGAPTMTVIINDLIANSDYLVRCKFENESGASAYSGNVFASTAPPAPGPIFDVVTSVTSSSISLKWKHVYPQAVTFRVEMGSGIDKHIFKFRENFCSFGDLSPYTSYPISIVATSSNGESLPYVIDTYTASIPPSAPRSFTATELKPRSVRLNWVQPELLYGLTISSYKVEQVELEDSYYNLEAGPVDAPVLRSSTIYTGNDTSCVIGGIHPASSYTFRVHCTNEKGSSPYTLILLVHTPDDVPEAVEILDARPVSSTSALIKFPCVNSYNSALLNYNVRINLVKDAIRYTGDGDSYSSSYSADMYINSYEQIVPLKNATLHNELVSLLIPNLDPSCEYEFEVSSISTVGASDWSNVSHPVTTLQGPPPRPDPPCVAGTSTDSISLSWHNAVVLLPNLSNIPKVKYTVLFSFDGKLYEELISTSSKHTTHTGLNPGTSVHYKLQASTSSGVSPTSHAVAFKSSADIPLPYTFAPDASDIQSSSLRLKWKSHPVSKYNGSVVKSYTVQRRTGQNGQWENIHSALDTITKINKLKPATHYAFRIFASNDVGGSEPGPFTEITTKNPVPTVCTEIKANVNKKGDLTLSWNGPSSSSYLCAPEGYIIEATSHIESIEFEEISKVKSDSLYLTKKNVDGLLGDHSAVVFRVAAYCDHGHGPFTTYKWVSAAKEKVREAETALENKKQREAARELRALEEAKKVADREMRAREKYEQEYVKASKSTPTINEEHIVNAIKPKVAKKILLPFKWKLALASLIPIILMLILWMLIGENEVKKN